MKINKHDFGMLINKIFLICCNVSQNTQGIVTLVEKVFENIFAFDIS